MLSRVAERLYWFSRYMERIESTARLMTVNTSLLLDLPRQVKIGWGSLVDITGIHEPFYARFQNADERNVVRFLLTDPDGSSITGAVSRARENARTTRDILPSEIFELVNDLYLFVREHGVGAVARGSREAFLGEVIRHCHELTGIVEGGLAHNTTRDFIAIGRALERADMTTRIVDVGSGNFLAVHKSKSSRRELQSPEPFDNILWMSVLRSLSAFQMYRQHVQERVNGPDVVVFLLQNALHPRAVVRCLTRIGSIVDNLPNNERVQSALTLAQRLAWKADVGDLMGDELHAFIDDMQQSFNTINAAISASWFLPKD